MPRPTIRTGAVPLAVLGDSDSQGYRDPSRIPPRGGEFRGVTLQWTEILNRLRPDEIDQGEVGSWGMRRRYLTLSRLVGRHARLLAKRDFRFNFAADGARCAGLTEGYQQQLDPLLGILKADPDGWSRGIVVIRIGVNDFFRTGQIDDRLQRGLDGQAELEVAACVDHIATVVRRIRAVNAEVFVLVSGLFNELEAGAWMERTIPPEQLHNVVEILDGFEAGIKVAVGGDSRAAVLDERVWWSEAWGGHDPVTGEPRPHNVSLGGSIPVSNTQGDHPRNAILSDGHAGTVVNAYWVNHLLRALDESAGIKVAPLDSSEIARLVDPDGALGMAPPRSGREP